MERKARTNKKKETSWPPTNRTSNRSVKKHKSAHNKGDTRPHKDKGGVLSIWGERNADGFKSGYREKTQKGVQKSADNPAAEHAKDLRDESAVRPRRAGRRQRPDTALEPRAKTQTANRLKKSREAQAGRSTQAGEKGAHRDNAPKG